MNTSFVYLIYILFQAVGRLFSDFSFSITALFVVTFVFALIYGFFSSNSNFRR